MARRYALVCNVRQALGGGIASGLFDGRIAVLRVVNSHPRNYITGFRGVIEQGYLVRVWGVARDVTELVDLNERLRQNQDRLKLYARELVGAEERARRATAVDLHDGIGQQLVGLSMTLMRW